MTKTLAVPAFDRDFWSDAVILDPYPVYAELRELGQPSGLQPMAAGR